MMDEYMFWLYGLKTCHIFDVVICKADVRDIKILDCEYVEEETDDSLENKEDSEDYKEEE